MFVKDGSFIVGDAGHYGEDITFRSGALVGFADLVDGDGGGTFRVTLKEGLTPPDKLSTISGTVEIRRENDKTKLKLMSWKARYA